nr:Flp family type IVb pilin [uncultured Enterobacter sp.]
MKDLFLKAYVSGTNAVRSFANDQRGVTAVEYAIVIAGVSAVVAVIFGSGGTVEKMLNEIFTNVSTNVMESMTPKG